MITSATNIGVPLGEAPSTTDGERTAGDARRTSPAGASRNAPPAPSARGAGPGRGERATAITAGVILASLGLARRTLPGYLVAGLGGALLLRGANARGGERRGSARAIHVEWAVLIDRPASELYDYWRNFSNLPRIMDHLERVDTGDGRRSHWVAKTPLVSGGGVEWDAEVTREEPGSLIAWRSLPGSEIDIVGEVRFARALGDRGTEVRVSMDYLPVGGRPGHWAATLLGEGPRRQLRDGLRSFKQLMEVGDLLTNVGQPRGTCLGGGKRQASE